MPEPSPVVLFCYKRPDHTRQTLEALRLNSLAARTELYVFSDAPRTEFERTNVDEVRRVLARIDGFKSVNVVERSANLGLARSVITGVSSLFERYERLVVLEDDIVTAPDYLAFINEALAAYETESRVFSVTGFNFPIAIDPSYPFDAYFSYRCNSWGWATWRDRWRMVDWDVQDYPVFKSDVQARRQFNRGGNDLANMLDLQFQGKIDSWAIRWCYAHYQNNAFCVFPVQSRVRNIGFDGTGVHCGVTDRLSVEIGNSLSGAAVRFPREIRPDPRIVRAFYRFNSIRLRWRLKSFLKSFLKPFLA
ncbi:MAG TPA: sugar transferase [Terriglobia bacterium]|jgi:hypothetical protein